MPPLIAAAPWRAAKAGLCPAIYADRGFAPAGRARFAPNPFPILGPPNLICGAGHPPHLPSPWATPAPKIAQNQ